MTDDYRRGLEDAAKIADFYATENFRLSTDTWMIDPARAGDFSPKAKQVSEKLIDEGFMHASMAHAAQNIAKAIREGIK